MLDYIRIAGYPTSRTDGIVKLALKNCLDGGAGGGEETAVLDAVRREQDKDAAKEAWELKKAEVKEERRRKWWKICKISATRRIGKRRRERG